MLEALKACLPNVRRIGHFTLRRNRLRYDKEKLEKAAKCRAWSRAVGVTDSNNVSDAATTLGGRHLDAWTQISDN